MKLCTICVRGGSKGVPGKNIRSIGGKPLLAHSIAHARDSGLFAAIAVSSDSAEVLQIAQDWGADILVNRPAELASDRSAKIPAIRHCMLAAETHLGAKCDVLVDLDATSPLRSSSDIVAAVAMLDEDGCANVITGAPARRSPYFNLVELDAQSAPRVCKMVGNTVTRRQDSPACYDMNASIYAWTRNALMQNDMLFLPGTRLYVMPEVRSWDIDSELDFQIVGFILERGLNSITDK